MKKWTKLVAAAVSAAGLALGGLAAAAPATATTAAYCGITWGSLPKTGGEMSAAPLTNVRAGRHDCYDRMVIDIAAGDGGFSVSNVPTVHDQAGHAMSLRGGAFLEVTVLDPAYDSNGASTYSPANPQELVGVAGWRTFRQLSWGGSFEGYSTIGLGVRARLPFRVFTLDGPGTGSRIVVDVAHRW